MQITIMLSSERKRNSYEADKCFFKLDDKDNSHFMYLKLTRDDSQSTGKFGSNKMQMRIHYALVCSTE